MADAMCPLCGHFSTGDTEDEAYIASLVHSQEVHPPGAPQSPLPPIKPPVPLP